MLQEFLDAGLLQIKDETEKFSALKHAAEAIAKSLEGEPGKLIPFTLVALDPEVPKDDPAILEAEEAVKVNWTTVRARYKETPVQNYRGVLWEALELAAHDAPRAAAVIWLTGSSYLPLSRLEKRAHVVCRAFLRRMGDQAEAEAVKSWTVKPASLELKVPTLDLAAEQLSYGTIDKAKLADALLRAAGPLGSTNPPNHNPYWSHNNQQWAQEFGTRAADAVKQQADIALKTSGEGVVAHFKRLETPLKKFGAALGDTVQKAVKQAVNGTLSQQRRSALLWWKETLYSESRKRGYRGLNTADTSVLMAHDLHKEVLPFTPQSVDYLLRETMRSAQPSSLNPVKLSAFIDDLKRDEQALALSELFPEVTETGRLGLLDFSVGVLRGQWPASALTDRTGLLPTRSLPPDELAVVLFHDLQAHLLIEA